MAAHHQIAMQEPRAERISDIDIARRAAAEVSKREGYDLDRLYLAGDCDRDADVQTALVAITLLRQTESVVA